MLEQRVQTEQGELNFSQEKRGRGHPILFVHSDGGTLHHWDDVRSRLSDKRPTVAFDRRGHGKSQPPNNGSFDKVEEARDIGLVADAAGYDRFVLVGHSGGATVAFAYAGLAPESVAGLLLVDPPPDPAVMPPDIADKTMKAMDEDFEGTIKGYYASIAGDDPKVVKRVLDDALATRPETIKGVFEAGNCFDPKTLAGRYRGPALSVIQPDYDVEGALHRIGGFPHVVIGGAGHWIHLGAPARFNAELDGFLAMLDQAGSTLP